jgi:hypothetical protein
LVINFDDGPFVFWSVGALDVAVPARFQKLLKLLGNMKILRLFENFYERKILEN